LTDAGDGGGNDDDDDDDDVEIKSSSLTVHQMPPCRRMILICETFTGYEHAECVLCFVSSHATDYATRHLYHKSLCDVTDELAKRHGFVTVLR
jgi:hypothetical protein